MPLSKKHIPTIPRKSYYQNSSEVIDMDIQDAAWARFLQSGHVSDYMQYCLLRGTTAPRSYTPQKQSNTKKKDDEKGEYYHGFW
ncbi:MAG: hypothetical protein FWG82_00145 [Oscillospiraceae bacterium]|nr:hypothetical protein [Oscillospiraceae bacterium]